MDDKLLKYFEITADKKMVVKPSKYVEVRITDDYFENRISEIVGDCVETFGFLDILAWDEYDEHLKDSDAVKIAMRMPVVFITKPTRIVHDSKNSLTILEYHGGDLLITTLLIPKNSSVVARYVDLVLRGKIPDDIPYDQIVNYLEKCTIINGVDMKVNSIFLDLMVMMVSRDPNNLARQFREAIKDNPKMSMLSRKLVNMDIVPSITSQFSAISSGNPKYGITSSIGAVNSGAMVNSESDIENAIK